ncbi:hypothetical protein CDD81_5598 [Ophiocordyceps australis]|uniref:RanBD1 domain-containing protein n=1 Tax=Ophiocordyceps australis TaxID=1399860 RepID=A0A2C5XDE9_9HYPO|nr:hypothetical protein CDD81_5598 [Ophiocordyceps australis]
MSDKLEMGSSPKSDLAYTRTTSEDDETRATRRGLKQSSISGTRTLRQGEDPNSMADSPSSSDARNDDTKEHPASPKKKRAYDQVEEDVESRDSDANSVSSTDSCRDRASRLEPEKKRHRDEEPLAVATAIQPTAPDDAATPSLSANGNRASSQDAVPNMKLATYPPSAKQDRILDSNEAPSTTSVSKSDDCAAKETVSPCDNKTTETNSASNQPLSTTSASAFAASGFSKLAQNPSAFAVFGASTSSTNSSLTQTPLSSFASTTANSAPRLTFESTSGASPFAGLTSATNGFGRGLGFGSRTSGMKPLSSFAAPGKVLSSSKPAKPFGAPDSDSDDADSDAESACKETDRNDIDEDAGLGEDDGPVDDMANQDKEPEDKKRTKLHKVEIDDGETGEVTILSIRSKMFSLDKDTGWKERGAGMLKINVPRSCVEIDEAGAPIPGSLHALGADTDGKHKNTDDGASKGRRMARLIMRQDQTHRVILNTAIVPAMQFQEKTSLKSTGILFTAFEGSEAKPVSVTIKMSAANAKAFVGEIQLVQRILKEN